MSKGEETRARIVARAAELFNTRGYSGTAITDVMQAVALEKGGIYRHFASKDELALAAFDYAAEQVRGRVTAAMAGAAHTADRLLAFIAVFARYVDDPPLTGGCPILNTAIDSDDAHPLLHERVRTALIEWQTLLSTTIVAGIERGELRADVDPEQLATLLIVTLEGAVMMSRTLRDPRPLRWATDHLREYVEIRIKRA